MPTKLERGTCLVCGLQRAIIPHDNSILTHSRTVERNGELVTERCPGSRMVVVSDRNDRVRLALAPVREAQRSKHPPCGHPTGKRRYAGDGTWMCVRCGHTQDAYNRSDVERAEDRAVERRDDPDGVWARCERLAAALREADKNLSLRVGYDRRPDAHYLNRAHEVIRAALRELDR